MSGIAVTFVGTATTLLEVGGGRLLTDPVLDPPGASYPAVPWLPARLGRYTRLSGPALPAEGLGDVDAVLLSHDQHGDNLDAAGRAILPAAGAVLTTPAAARRLRRQGLPGARGLSPGERWRSGRFEVRAAPARHGPWGSGLLAGPVTGFLVTAGGRSVYVSGDTVWFGALARFARSLARPPDLALVHVGAARFRATRGLRFTADAGDLLALARAWPGTRLAPIHYEGWSHFSEGRAALEARLRGSEAAGRVVWLEPGRRTELGEP